MTKPFIIAIDGPSGAGKSTLGRRLARELGLLYIDTGAMYRAVALAAAAAGVKDTDAEGLTCVAHRARIRLEGDPDSLRVFLDERDVSEEIRGEAAGRGASVVSAVPGVRRELVRRQREMGEAGAGCVLDGRDIGTVVCPRADIKLFVTASAEVRAERRHRELLAKGESGGYEAVLADIRRRDARDSSRAAAPLRPAADAALLDTTELDAESAFRAALDLVAARWPRVASHRVDSV